MVFFLLEEDLTEKSINLNYFSFKAIYLLKRSMRNQEKFALNETETVSLGIDYQNTINY